MKAEPTGRARWPEFYDREATRLIDTIKVPIPEGARLYFKFEDTEQGKPIGPITLQLKDDDGAPAEFEIPDTPPKARPYDPQRAHAKHFGGVTEDAVEFGWNYHGVAKEIAKRLALELVTT